MSSRIQTIGDVHAELQLVEAELLSRSLSRFARAAWPVLCPGIDLLWSWHLDLICGELQLVTPHPTTCVTKLTRDLVINIAPRSLKSYLVSVLWPAWVWTWKPSHQWLTASAASDLAARDATRARRLIESEWYHERWPGVTFADDENRINRYVNTAGGHRVVTSVGSGRLGYGGDTIIVDDPHKLVGGYASAADCDATAAWWDQVMVGRRNDPKTSSRVIVMQRVHARDLTEHCLGKGTYRHVCLPTEYDPDHPYVHPDDPRTELGELLHPERLGEEEVAQLQADLGLWGYTAQHTQLPSPLDGGILLADWWRRMPRSDFPDDFDRVVLSGDLSMKGKEQSDYNAIFVLGLAGDTVYGLARVHRRMGFGAQLRAIRELYDDWPGVDAVYLEDAANGAAVHDILHSEIPGLILVRSVSDKVVRAQSWAPRLETGRCVLPEGEVWADDLIAECTAFPAGRYDDQVDAWGQGMRELTVRGEFALGLVSA